MPQVDRFSVSLDTELLAAFDAHIASKGYENRSEAVRDMIRDLLVANRRVDGDAATLAILTLVCDHRIGEAPGRLRTSLAESADVVLGSYCIPVDDHRDGVAVILRGPASRVQAVANRIQGMRGILHGHMAVIPREP